MMVRKSIGVLFFITALLTSALAPAARPKQIVRIGGLFSLSSGWVTLANSSAAAIQIAADDVNVYFEKIGLDLSVQVSIKDTGLSPNEALKKLQEFKAEGVHLVMGPQSSSEIANIRTFAQQNGILLFSPSSTAGSLSVEDNVFRLCPDDGLEGEASAALMHADGIRTVVPLWRDDAGNNGLEASTRRHFTAAGGNVSSGVKYGATTADFTQHVAALEAQVQAAISQQNGNPDEVGIYHAAFDEVVPIFQLAANSSILSSIRWYGSDGVAQNQPLLNDPTAAAFAKHVGFPTALPGLPAIASVVWRPIVKKIKAQTGADPEAFALGVYDAVWIAARTVALKPTGELSIPFVKRNIRGFASSYFGATGWTILNKAGDRKFGDFDFWAIRNSGGTDQWVRVASYSTGTKVLTRR